MSNEAPLVRSFGWVFAAFFTLVGMVRPEWLAPLNRVWMAPGGTLVPAQRSAALARFSYALF